MILKYKDSGDNMRERILHGELMIDGWFYPCTNHTIDWCINVESKRGLNGLIFPPMFRYKLLN